MLQRIQNIFRTDAFIPSGAVFPDIDAEKIAAELKLDDQAKTRGAANQPASDETNFDSVEMRVIERIEELRRKGLENYEANRRVYAERLSRAAEARKEVEIVAGKARSDFIAEVSVWKSFLATPKENLLEAFNWRNTFRKKNNLERPAVEFGGWPKTLALGLVLILIETGLNGYLFAQKNTLGLLGGILAALLVSISNVGVSGLAGYFCRIFTHRNWILKFLGILIVALWIVFAGGFNLAVAHFRDAVESIGNWSEAAKLAQQTLVGSPAGIASIESWLLVVMGCLISFLAFLKGINTDDAYPRYGRISRAVLTARTKYADTYEDAIGRLDDHRNSAIDDLKAAHEEVRVGISEAVDSLFGQSSLQSQLGSFLEQCDIKTALLLSRYRDANRTAREEKAPKSFEKTFQFEKFEVQTIEQPRKTNAEAEAKQVSDLVDKTIAEIFTEFEASVRTYKDIESVQGNAVVDPPQEAASSNLPSENASSAGVP